MYSNKHLTLDELCKNHSFFKFFMLVEAYKELYQCESRWALGLTLIISIVLYTTNTILQNAYDLLAILVPLGVASIGLIGFLFSGLALMSAIISVKTINVIDKDKKIKPIAGILFSFFYCGGIIISSLFLSIILYLYFRLLISGFININMDWVILVLMSLVIYFYIYSIIYTVALLGACLKLFFLNIKYENKNVIKSTVSPCDKRQDRINIYD